MTQLILILTVLLLTSCCCKYGDKDFEFTLTHNNLLKPYSVNDTVYFRSQQGDLDTITISKIDTFQQCGCFMAGNRRNISINIKHLPINRWTGGTESFQNKPPKVLDQEMMVIEKNLDTKKTPYFIGINYRDFTGEIKDISNTTSDNRFQQYGISKYWTIPNDVADWEQYRNDSTLIIKVFWTENYGLTAYELRNGSIYEILKTAPR